MATVLQDQNNYQDPNQQQQQNPSTTTNTGSNAPVQPVTSGAPATTATAAPAGTSSGGFTNIQKYLEANKPSDNTQSTTGQQLAKRVGQEQQNVYQQIGQNVADTQNAQNQAATYGGQNAAQVPDYLNQVMQRYNTVTTPTGGGTPTTGLTAQDIANFGAIRQAQYSGPNQLTNYGGLAASTQTAQQNAAMGTTEPGQYALLQKYFASPSYSQGQQKLDQLLLQNSPEANAQLGQLRAQAGQLTPQLQQAEQAAEAQGTQYQAQTQAARDAAQAALTGAITGGQTDLSNRAAAANATANAAYQNMLNEHIGKSEEEQLGIDPGLRLGNGLGQLPVDVRAYMINNAGAAATNQNIANAQDFAKAAALGQLAGDPTQTFLQGTYDPNAAYDQSKQVYFDAAGFNAAAGAQKAYLDRLEADKQARKAALVAPWKIFGGDFQKGMESTIPDSAVQGST